jgi:uncharacterized DUF497 family protein
MEFDWDLSKNAKNLQEHGIDFEDVKPLFATTQPHLDKEDDREDYGEERRIRLGHLEGLPVYVVYTMRGRVVWIISARLAEPAEEETLIAMLEGEKKLQQAKWNEEESMAQKKKQERKRIDSKKERQER